MKTFRIMQEYGFYVNVNATTKRKAIQQFKKDYKHLVSNNRMKNGFLCYEVN